MKLLRLVQHVAWDYRSGAFLDAVDKASPAMRIGVLVGTGALVALVVPCWRV